MADEVGNPQYHTCERCGTVVGIGSWPFCKGNPADHGRTYEKTSAFPFVTPHINGKPMTIESLGHLRQVERDYGVVLTAFSNNPGNWNDNIKGDLPKFREGGRHHRD